MQKNMLQFGTLMSVMLLCATDLFAAEVTASKASAQLNLARIFHPNYVDVAVFL